MAVREKRARLVVCTVETDDRGVLVVLLDEEKPDVTAHVPQEISDVIERFALAEVDLLTGPAVAAPG
jgi:hypothetical protein